MIEVWAKGFAILQIYTSYPIHPPYTPQVCIPFSQDMDGFVARISGVEYGVPGIEHDTVYIGIVINPSEKAAGGGCFSAPDIVYQQKLKDTK